MNTREVQYIADEQGDVTSVMVPISLWQEMVSELETHHLLQHENMKQRLIDSLAGESQRREHP